ncbi:hypothetical protein HK100_011016 [Physocladia obscura]|uniref:Uncharacterized protein n=1 Tax=Physocladia obscura TaxID=109957 RepID=A0AAD5XEF9_9FUNG|nr:hypothetical protein HK100_011016 [Physocladia obscura]
MYAIQSTTVQIYSIATFNGLLTIIAGFAVMYIKGVILPNIQYYNLAHASLGAIGKMIVISGITLTQQISKDYVANALIKRTNGVSLSTIARSPRFLAPRDGLVLRRLFLVSVVAVEITIWYLMLNMQWTGVSTNIGSFACVPVLVEETMTTATKALTPQLDVFLEGDADGSVIGDYGIPLNDGLIGGWAAWPLAAPADSFYMERDGVVFAVAVSCGLPTVSEPTSGNIVVQGVGIKIANASLDSEIGVFSATLITLGGTVGQQKITIFQGMNTTGYNFNNVVASMGSLTTHLEVMALFVNIFEYVAKNLTTIPFRNGIEVSFLQWGINSDATAYDVNKTWMAISGLIGIISHYVLVQYNGTENATCLYSGIQKAGIIGMPSNASFIVLSFAIACLMLNLIQLSIFGAK